KRVASRAADHASAAESELQKGEELDVDLLSINKRIRNVRMSLKAPKELVDSDRTQVPKKTRKEKRLRIHEPDHRYRFDVVTPHHRVRSRRPGKALPADSKLEVVHVYGGVSIE